MKKILILIAVCVALTASLASASVIPCLSSNIADVTVNADFPNPGPPGSFLCDGRTYSNFNVSTSSGIVVGVDKNTTGLDTTTGAIDVGFQLVGVTNPTTADIQLNYTVSGGTSGIDESFTNGTANGQTSIQEIVCNTIPQSNGSCFVPGTQQLVNNTITSTTAAANAICWFNPSQSITCASGPATQSPNEVWIHKDISLVTGFISEFSNSNEVPEPSVFILLGGGLLGLGILRRKKA